MTSLRCQLVEETLPFVHPDLGYSEQIVVQNFPAAFAREVVRRSLAEDVTDMGAGKNLYSTTTLPYL